MTQGKNGEGKSHDEPKGKNEITIHIGKNMYKVALPVTGATLYALGVDINQYDLWLEVPGQGDDILIGNNESELDVKDGTHFYTAQKNLNPGSMYV